MMEMGINMDSNELDEHNDVTVKDKKSGYKSGIFHGIIIGVLLVLTLCSIAVAVVFQKGLLNIDTQNGIYIHNQEFDENTGIGSKASQKLNLIDQALDQFYFEDIDDEEVLDKIYKAYVNAYGDKYTVYYTAEEYKSIQESSDGEYCGIGVSVRKNDDGTVLVVEPYEGSPGKEAGLVANDLIISVNGESVIDRDISMIVAQIKGEEGTTVDVEVRREGVADPIKMTIERRKIEVRTISYEMLDNSIGYIIVNEFDKVTTQQFKNAYNDLKSQGMKGLIIDIRSNPGGLLTTVVDMLDEILPDGLIVYTEDKNKERVEYNGTNPNQADVPIAVLVNGESASASEIFAGAIQDYGVGTIIGTKTFGKGIVQTVRRMTDGSAIKYTVSKYYTPKGQDIHGNGVQPDIVVELAQKYNSTEYNRSNDTQLQAAINNITEKIDHN